jgi:hypothetical protein
MADAAKQKPKIDAAAALEAAADQAKRAAEIYARR